MVQLFDRLLQAQSILPGIRLACSRAARLERQQTEGGCSKILFPQAVSRYTTKKPHGFPKKRLSNIAPRHQGCTGQAQVQGDTTACSLKPCIRGKLGWQQCDRPGWFRLRGLEVRPVMQHPAALIAQSLVAVAAAGAAPTCVAVGMAVFAAAVPSSCSQAVAARAAAACGGVVLAVLAAV